MNKGRPSKGNLKRIKPRPAKKKRPRRANPSVTARRY